MSGDGRLRTEQEQYARLNQLFARDRDRFRTEGDDSMADAIEAARVRAAQGREQVR